MESLSLLPGNVQASCQQGLEDFTQHLLGKPLPCNPWTGGPQLGLVTLEQVLAAQQDREGAIPLPVLAGLLEVLSTVAVRSSSETSPCRIDGVPCHQATENVPKIGCGLTHLAGSHDGNRWLPESCGLCSQQTCSPLLVPAPRSSSHCWCMFADGSSHPCTFQPTWSPSSPISVWTPAPTPPVLSPAYFVDQP